MSQRMRMRNEVRKGDCCKRCRDREAILCKRCVSKIRAVAQACQIAEGKRQERIKIIEYLRNMVQVNKMTLYDSNDGSGPDAFGKVENEGMEHLVAMIERRFPIESYGKET